MGKCYCYFHLGFRQAGGLQFVIVEARGEAARRRSNARKGATRLSRGESGNSGTEEAENLLKSGL